MKDIASIKCKSDGNFDRSKCLSIKKENENIIYLTLINLYKKMVELLP